MSNSKNQHIIPQCYLKQFIDPQTPKDQEPYVWIFERDSKRGKKKAPKNILAETDFFTLESESGGKDYVIEKKLSQIESEYSTVFEKKIRKKLPLDHYEHIVLCAFVAAMLQRTLKQKEHIENFMDQIISMGEQMEKVHGVPPKSSLEWKKVKESIHKISVIEMIPHMTKILMRMNLAFLCSNKRGSFITSDSPCYLFNSQLQFQRFYGPDLRQKHVEVKMPLSPEISLCFSWVNNVRGYLEIDTDQVHDSNRMTFGHSYHYFIANSPKIKRRWFRRFPLDPIFIYRILRNKAQLKWRQIQYYYKYHA